MNQQMPARPKDRDHLSERRSERPGVCLGERRGDSSQDLQCFAETYISCSNRCMDDIQLSPD